VNTGLWVASGILAAAFLVAGSNKLFVPPAKLAKAPGGGWVLDFAVVFVKTLGAFEVLGAIGLILPTLLDTAPFLTPLAGIGLGVIMVGAANVEFRRNEYRHVLVNITYFVLLAFVVFGRFLTA